MKHLCQLFEINRSSYRYWRNKPKTKNTQLVKEKAMIKAIHVESNGSAGARTIAKIATGAWVCQVVSCLDTNRLLKHFNIVSW
ncbi:hypothetical protein [Aliikangiella maris]|uniref:Transposase n=1 Tax=Aliikangiella maris TaxID=3162458 RepID=A0ABV3MUF4_9GAMM